MLEVSNKYNLSTETFPPSLVELSLVNHSQERCQLLSSIKILNFGMFYDGCVNQFPPKLTHLTFGNSFNRECPIFPDTVTHLKFGFKFNCTIASFPAMLRDLRFGHSFSQNLNNLPSSLEVLFLSKEFRATLVLPPKLVKLQLLKICAPLDRAFQHSPATLQCLTVSNVVVPNNGLTLPRLESLDVLIIAEEQYPGITTLGYQRLYPHTLIREHSELFYVKTDEILTSYFFDHYLTTPWKSRTHFVVKRVN